MTRLPGALTAGLLALSLAGCSTATGSGGPQASRPDSAPVQGAPVQAVAVSAPPAPAASEGNPDRLRGLDPEAVVQLIGMPGYVRRDGGVTVWQYHAGGCVMDLFWYPTSSGPRVAHYEARGLRLASAAEPRSCFGSLLGRRRDAATS